MSGAACGQGDGRGGGEVRMCACCGTEAGVKVCSRCHSVYYCGVACQKSHWAGGHKKECADLAEAMRESAACGQGDARGGGEVRMCACCGTEAGVKVCSGCHSVYYCNGDCQKSHWAGGHKKECALLGMAYAGEKNTSAERNWTEGRFDKAQKKLEKSLQVLQEHASKDGKDKADVARTLINLGRILRDRGLYEEALEKLVEGLQVSREFSGHNDNNFVAQTLSEIANVYCKQGKYELCLRTNEEALEIRLEMYGPDHAAVGNTYLSMGITLCQESVQDYDKALEYLEKALKIFRTAYGPVHDNIASTLMSIGTIMSDLHKYDLAIRKFEEACQILLKVDGAEYPQLTTAYHDLGLTYDKLGHYDKELEVFDKALAITLKVLGTDHIEVAKLHYNIARTYCAKGFYKEGRESFEACVKVCTRVLGADHARTQDAIEQASVAGFAERFFSSMCLSGDSNA